MGFVQQTLNPLTLTSAATVDREGRRALLILQVTALSPVIILRGTALGRDWLRGTPLA
jgi:hypothetical protein